MASAIVLEFLHSLSCDANKLFRKVIEALNYSEMFQETNLFFQNKRHQLLPIWALCTMH